MGPALEVGLVWAKLGEVTVLGEELLANGKGGCWACGGSWDCAAGVKADEAEGMEALGAAGVVDGLTDVCVAEAPKGRAVLL